jgi:hypothetical protein
MSNRDNSHSAYIRRLKAQAISNYKRENPTHNYNSYGSLSSEDVFSHIVGAMPRVYTSDNGTRNETSSCCTSSCTTLPSITNFNWTFDTYGPFDPPYDSYNVRFILTWDSLPAGTTFSFSSTTDFISSYTTVLINSTSAYIYYNTDPFFEIVTITATNSCSSVSATTQFPPCFLAGSLVSLANKTQIPIEDIKVGDELFGAFGEINKVLALHRPLLGNTKMLNINNEHHTSLHHPHIGLDKKFYSYDPLRNINDLYNKSYPVINEDGLTEYRKLEGVSKSRFSQMNIGSVLKTIDGFKQIESLEIYELPSNTQMYNLVMSGSHTYCVDGYAVTGWPSETDFDYDCWELKN